MKAEANINAIYSPVSVIAQVRKVDRPRWVLLAIDATPTQQHVPLHLILSVVRGRYSAPSFLLSIG